MPSSHRLVSRNRIIGAAVIVALLVAMILNTKFLTPEELAAALPKPFNPQETAKGLYDKAKAELPGSAAELGEVIPAIQDDPEAAAAKYKAVAPNESTLVFPVKTTATVATATEESLRLTVEGVRSATPVLVPLGTAVNGTVIRDVTGFKFADAPGQTEYQYVGDELKKLMQAEISAKIDDPKALEGKEVSLVGAISVPNTGAPPAAARPVNIQVVTIEVAP
jgi:predicted lipoprotein